LTLAGREWGFDGNKLQPKSNCDFTVPPQLLINLCNSGKFGTIRTPQQSDLTKSEAYLLMKSNLFLGLLLLTTMMTNISSGQPPLLDRKLFFGNPQISGGQLSPDGKFITFMKAYNGIMNVWIKRFSEPFEKARPLTDSTRPLYGYSWTEDGKYILYVKDSDGDENMNLFAVDPTAPATDGKDVPISRNLTPLKEVTAQIVHSSKNNPDLLWVGLNDRDKAWHDLYRLSISTGELTLLYKNTERITGYEFDWDDNLRLVSRTDEAGNTTLLRKDGDQLEEIYVTNVTESAGVIGWDADNKNIYLETNKGDLDLSTVFVMNPATKELKLFESDPEKRVDFGDLQIDRNTRQVISTSYTDDKTRIYWRDKTWESNYNFLKEKFPGREISFQSSTKDYSKFLVAVHGDKFASEAYYFDTQARELIHQYTPRPELKAVEQHLAPMTAVRYRSSDGLEIPAYLTLPVGFEQQNLPVVVLVHGGPKGPRDNWGYDPHVQFLANRGYAVLQPNFRASGGYGKKFMNAGDMQWGKLMQDDITWGVKYLIEKGVADKARVAIMGGSYGGYATLAGLAFTPDVYACGVDIVGPSNILTLLNSIPAYWESGRAFLYGMVGNPESAEGMQRIREASPLFSAEKIVKPLLIIQGANDPRVKQAEADQIVIALRDRGHDVSYLLAKDEGHGFAKPLNQMAMYAEIERFLAEKIGGRYDATMPEDVRRQLEELRVDISQVTYDKPTDFKVAKALPALNVQLKEGTENWDIKIQAQGQTLAMKAKRSIVKVDQGWKIAEAVSGALGEMQVQAIYSADLKPLSRMFKQGPVSVAVQYQEGKIDLQLGDKQSTVNYAGAFLCDGPGQEAILQSLPLKEGFELNVHMLDLAGMKIESARLKVEGSEVLDGVDTLKVSVTNIESPSQKTTFWLNTKDRVVVRSEQVLPQDAVLTKTLAK
jgi:dipeptidyl aminopeptidase/acylaminoacyl peptidase